MTLIARAAAKFAQSIRSHCGDLTNNAASLGVARRLLQERPLQLQHGNVRVKSWRPMSSNSWSISSQPDFVRAPGIRKTVRNRQSNIYIQSCSKVGQLSLGRFLANSPSHVKLRRDFLSMSEFQKTEAMGHTTNR